MAIRSGDHPGFGRLVLDLPPGEQPVVSRVAGGVTIQLRLQAIGPSPPLPRNATAISVSGGEVRVTTLPGASARWFSLPNRVVLDVFDPPRPAGVSAAYNTAGIPTPATVPPAPAKTVSQNRALRPKPAAPAPAARPVAAAASAEQAHVPEHAHSPEPARPPSDPAAAPNAGLPASSALRAPADSPSPAPPTPGAESAKPGAAPAAAPESHVVPDSDTAALQQRGFAVEPIPAAASGPAPVQPAQTKMRLPIPATAGLAAFRRGGFGLLVIDADRPANPAAWRNLPGMADAQVQNLPDATVVVVELAPEAALWPQHDATGWTLGMGEPASEALAIAADPSHLTVPARAASRVVSVADPMGGGTLLVGTQRDDGAPQRITVARHLPALTLLATWRGVAIEPLSDTLDMRALAPGFALDLGPQRGVVGPLGRVMGADLRRVFDLPPLPVPALLNRLAAASGAVSTAGSRARGPAQLKLAESLLALGMGVEAQAVLRLAAADDGRIATRTDAIALGGAAALLAGRPAEAGGLDDPSVLADETGSDEVALWRALRAARMAAETGVDAPSAAARTLALKSAVAQAYPEPLRNRLLPMMAQALVEGGEIPAATRLLAAAGEATSFGYARALLDMKAGRLDEALGRLDRLTAGSDRFERARAAVKAVELRLAAARLAPGKAADALEALIPAWRGDDREAALRLRVVALRKQAGQLPAALAMLRESLSEATASEWPEPRRAELRSSLKETFADAMARDEATPGDPLQFVTMVEENGDLVPAGAEGEHIARRVADRLAALDLPERAETALHSLIGAVPPGSARASLGSQLATMQLRRGDPQAALVTLSASNAGDLPVELAADRTMIYARATASRGNIAAATSALAALETPQAETLRAELFEQAHQWADASEVLGRLVGQVVSSDGAIVPPQTALVLRLASAAAQAGQEAVLDRLRTDILPRMQLGNEADMLRVLTAGPVRGVGDLPRAEHEVTLARSALR